MGRVTPIEKKDLPADVRSLIEVGEQLMGFTPNDALIMARNPALTKALLSLVQAVYGQGTLDPGLKRLIGYINSTAAGCVYCQVHTANGAHDNGVETAKIQAAWEYETSELFSEAERAALRVAQAAGHTPNDVTDEAFSDLKNYFSEDEIVEIVSVIAMFGFLNRWNSTLATELESTPLAFARTVDLKTSGEVK
ncbi:carboxymuconolactone decarboxylase family protein [Litorimonas haliclonae]|uniref:carboxymuconolactone decarboxylase family protein n=1 Tax=Litorimonas haliclonae TaxID=2081977 RepID=UPI0039EE9A9B